MVTDSAEGLRVRPRSPLDPGARVSIVLPTYNGTRYLAQAIESCLAQSFRDVELIVVDDGSRPDVRAVVEPYLSDSRVKYVRHEKNAGVAASLNTGFRIATGSHLTWTSDDNYFEPEAIAEMLRFMGAARPVIASAIPGNDEAVVDGVTGLLVPPRDPGAHAEAIRSVLADPVFAERLGRAGRERAEKEFSIEVMARRTMSVYSDALNSGGSERRADTAADTPGVLPPAEVAGKSE